MSIRIVRVLLILMLGVGVFTLWSLDQATAGPEQIPTGEGKKYKVTLKWEASGDCINEFVVEWGDGKRDSYGKKVREATHVYEYKRKAVIYLIVSGCSCAPEPHYTIFLDVPETPFVDTTGVERLGHRTILLYWREGTGGGTRITTTVKWGDGKETKNAASPAKHTYKEGGCYEARVILKYKRDDREGSEWDNILVNVPLTAELKITSVTWSRM